MTDVMRHHYARIRSVLIWVLFLNWIVALSKIIYGSITHCASMSADGFHSLSDGASNIVGLIGITIACQPRDKDHPYGHKKYETLYSLVIAAMLSFVAFNLLKEGIMRLHHPTVPVVNHTSIAVMLFSLAVNITVMRYERRRGQQLHSDILISDALHTRADIFTSCAVLVTLAGIKAGYPLADPIATMIIAGFIGYSAIEIFRQSSNVLCDKIAIVDESRIEEIVRSIAGVRACHKIRSRGRADDIYIDLHVQVEPDMHVDTAHRICYAIEQEITTRIPEVTDVVVHIEPHQ
jgi:cation diffusion facilitator family transporter